MKILMALVKALFLEYNTSSDSRKKSGHVQKIHKYLGMFSLFAVVGLD